MKRPTTRKRPYFTYTPIPHNFIEEWINVLTLNEIRVYLVIMRMTWGYGKPSDTIAISQITEITHLARRTVDRAIKSLKLRGMLTSSGDRGKPKRLEPTLVKYIEIPKLKVEGYARLQAV